MGFLELLPEPGGIISSYSGDGHSSLHFVQ